MGKQSKDQRETFVQYIADLFAEDGAKVFPTASLGPEGLKITLDMPSRDGWAKVDGERVNRLITLLIDRDL